MIVTKDAPVADETVAEGTTADPSAKAPRRKHRFVPTRRSIIGWAVVAVAASAGLGWLLSWSSPVPLREVVIVGASEDSIAAIRSAAAVPEGEPLRDVDAAAISARVLELPGITGVDLVLQRPWTVAVVVDERFPFAQIQNDGGFAVVDSSGELIRESKRKLRRLPEITGSQDSRIISFKVLGELPEALAETVAVVAAADNGFVTLTLRDGTLVELGAAESLPAKAELVLGLLKLKPKVINVVVPDRPALQGELKLPKRNRPVEESTG